MNRKLIAPLLALSASALLVGGAWASNARPQQGLATVFRGANGQDDAQTQRGPATVIRGANGQDDPQTERGWLGMKVAPLTDEVAEKLDITQQDGIVVLKVVAESPAADAGVEVNDVITAIDSVAVSTKQGLRDALQDVSSGDDVALTISRNGATQEITVTAGDAPARSSRGHRGGFPFIGGGGDLKDVPRDERFDHMLSAEYSVTDVDGNTITTSITFGTVASSTADSVTIDLNEGGQATYQVTEDTKAPQAVDTLAADDKVVVVTKNGSSDATAILPMSKLAKRKGHHGQGRVADGDTTDSAQEQRFRGSRGRGERTQGSQAFRGSRGAENGGVASAIGNHWQ